MFRAKKDDSILLATPLVIGLMKNGTVEFVIPAGVRMSLTYGFERHQLPRIIDNNIIGMILPSA
jgi:hypothetical protein